MPNDAAPLRTRFATGLVLEMTGRTEDWRWLEVDLWAGQCGFDWYKVDYYSVADDSNPVGPSHHRDEGVGRVVRGAAFSDALEEGRTANRHHQVEKK